MRVRGTGAVVEGVGAMQSGLWAAATKVASPLTGVIKPGMFEQRSFRPSQAADY